MLKLYENFHIFHFQKIIVSAETVRGNTVCTMHVLVYSHKSSCQMLELSNLSCFLLSVFKLNGISFLGYVDGE